MHARRAPAPDCTAVAVSVELHTVPCHLEFAFRERTRRRLVPRPLQSLALSLAYFEEGRVRKEGSRVIPSRQRDVKRSVRSPPQAGCPSRSGCCWSLRCATATASRWSRRTWSACWTGSSSSGRASRWPSSPPGCCSRTSRACSLLSSSPWEAPAPYGYGA